MATRDYRTCDLQSIKAAASMRSFYTLMVGVAMITESLVMIGLLCTVQNCDASFNFTLTWLNHTTTGSCDVFFLTVRLTFLYSVSVVLILGDLQIGRTALWVSMDKTLNTQFGSRTISSLQPWQVINILCDLACH